MNQSSSIKNFPRAEPALILQKEKREEKLQEIEYRSAFEAEIGEWENLRDLEEDFSYEMESLLKVCSEESNPFSTVLA